MAITRTARGGGQRVAGTPHAITLSSAPPNGDLLVLKIGLKIGATGSVSSISGVCATWTKLVAGWRAGSNTRVEIWYGTVTSSGTAVTITPSASMALSWEAESYNFSAGSAAIAALTAEGVGNADEQSDTQIVLSGETSGGVAQTILPTTATNWCTGISGIASTGAGTWSALSAGWTQGATTGAGSATLHPIYPYFGQNIAASAQSPQVTRSAAAFAGNAIAQISEIIAPTGVRYRAII